MKVFYFILCFALCQSSVAQLLIKKLNQAELPQNIAFKGNFIAAIRFSDTGGDNIVVLSLTNEKINNNHPSGDPAIYKALYAYRYKLYGNNSKQVWRIYDFVSECILSVNLNFVDQAFTITDLDKNGKAEIWIMYRISCRSDLSPSGMKIIMYEENKKYAARGSTQVSPSAETIIGGEFIFDSSFKNGPALFRDYAIKLWEKNRKENFSSAN